MHCTELVNRELVDSFTKCFYPPMTNNNVLLWTAAFLDVGLFIAAGSIILLFMQK